jgi:hypothetical protein
MTARNVLCSTFPKIPLDEYYWPEERAEVPTRKRAREDEGDEGKAHERAIPPVSPEERDAFYFTTIGFGSDTPCKMKRTATFSKVKKLLAKVKGLNPDDIYLADADGIKLEDDGTPYDYGMVSGCEILVAKKRS